MSGILDLNFENKSTVPLNFLEENLMLIYSKSYIPDDNSSFFCVLKENSLDYIYPWVYNREKNSDFIAKLYQQQVERYCQKGSFFKKDPIRICYILNNEQITDNPIFYVLDGQHRCTVYQRIRDEKPGILGDIPVIIDIVDNENEALELFKIINNRLQISLESLQQEKLIKIENMLLHYFSKYIKNTKLKPQLFGNQFPFIKKDKFVERIKNIDSFKNLSPETIVSRLIQLNEKISRLTLSERMKLKKNIKIETHEKADVYQFFLGYDPELKLLSTS